MKKSELNDKSIEELKKIEEDLIEEHRNIRFSEVLSSVGNPARKRIVKRDIARVKTILNEHKLGIRPR